MYLKKKYFQYLSILSKSNKISMKKSIRIFCTGAILCFSNLLTAQMRQGNWCGSYEEFEQAMQQDKMFEQKQRELEQFTEKYVAQNPIDRASASAKNSSVVRIIPVVVHVIHANGPENISKAQILSEIDALNRDFRRNNSDTTATPGPFKSIAADCEIEFQMAKLDPNGNCTDGINRVYSPLTVYARNNVKSLIYWPSNKYMNIWIVKSIRRADGTLPPAGTIIAGFAQFPGGSAATDGLVIASANFGTIGSAQGNKGRTTVHEVGHWLNLRHIWADDNGACSGSDFVNDTPNQGSENFSTCPTFPMLDACSPSGNGINFSNYMDYTDELCQNMYTVGQAARMNAALSSSTSNRNNLWSAGNLTATGVSTPTILCVADFSTNAPGNIVCEGAQISFSDVSFNGAATSRTWNFPGGTLVTPSTLSDSIVTIQYPIAGNYDVTLSVSNSTGSATVTKTGFVKVLPAIAAYNSTFYSESFENSALPNADWEIANLDGGVPVWQQNTALGFSGSACASLQNFSGDSADIDELISPTFNAANIPNLNFSFQVAYAMKNTGDNDALKIYTSIDCGRSWTLRTTINATTLDGSNPAQTAAFVPTLPSQWHKETVSVANLANKSNARIKFQFIGGGGNNIYIDDINIITPVGISENSTSELNFSLYPNPAKEGSVVYFNLNEKSSAKLEVFSILGNVVEGSNLGQLLPGMQKIEIGKSGTLSKGVYFVKVTVNNRTGIKKLTIE